MTFELELWREVSRHSAIETFLDHVNPCLEKRYRWVQGVALFSVSPSDRSSRCLAAVGAQADVWRFPVAQDLSGDALLAYDHWQRSGQVVPWHQMPAPLRPLLGAVGSARPFAMVPLSDADGHEGIAIMTGSTITPPVHLKQLHPLREPFAQALRNDRRLRALQRRQAAAEADRDALLLRVQRDTLDTSVVGADTGLRMVMERVERFARDTAAVLLVGEPGAGKEVIARALHTNSGRADGPLIRVNCGAIPATQIDAELFGLAQGTGPDAYSEPPGAFERADGGTLFLDEVGALPLSAQMRLLRFLQSGTFHRMGEERRLRADVRVVASTQRDLASMVRGGTFREDLWYRLNVSQIQLPPLRSRPEDIGTLAQHFADRAGRRLGGLSLRVASSDVALLQSYGWPGNANELATVIERAAILGDGRRLDVASALGMPAAAQALATATPLVPNETPLDDPETPILQPHRGSLNDAIVQRIHETLRRTSGMIEGKHGAAAILGVNPSTLRSRMRRLDVRWEDYRTPSTSDTGHNDPHD